MGNYLKSCVALAALLLVGGSLDASSQIGRSGQISALSKSIPAAAGDGAAADAASEREIELTLEVLNQLSLQAHGMPPVVERSPMDLARTLNGVERSQCEPESYGRASSGIGAANAQATVMPNGGASLALNLSATAIGGHYRTCVAGCDPFGRNCIGIVGHDTRADAFAQASVQVKIRFSRAAIQGAYDLKVHSNRPAGLEIKVRDPRGNELSADGDTVPLRVNPGDVFYAEAVLSGRVSNEGGCCKDELAKVALVDLRVEKPPLLTARRFMEPYIIGGKETKAHRNVVALLLRGELHCSGTVIAERTILTAAHCVHGYEAAIAAGQMTYIIGTVITAPEQGPKAVEASRLPRGNDAIQYDPTNQMHDIALLYTKEPVPVTPAVLHEKSPEWADVLNKRTLIFVGFGYNKDDKNEFIGSGIKREAPWMASEADDWRFYFKASGKGTCSGDSGGAAFYLSEDSMQLLLVGITSGGDSACSWGADTRVDAHHAWILANLKG